MSLSRHVKVMTIFTYQDLFRMSKRWIHDFIISCVHISV